MSRRPALVTKSTLDTARKGSAVVEVRSHDGIARDLIKKIAMDIGKEIAHHIEIMYPNAVKATTPNMLISVRNCTYNEIMEALDATTEEEILTRLERRKMLRRKIKSMMKAEE